MPKMMDQMSTADQKLVVAGPLAQTLIRWKPVVDSMMQIRRLMSVETDRKLSQVLPLVQIQRMTQWKLLVVQKQMCYQKL